MDIQEMLSALPSREDVAKVIGLQTRDSNRGGMLPALAIFGAGVLLGAGLALLLAPESSRDVEGGNGERVREPDEAFTHAEADAPNFDQQSEIPQPTS